MCQAGSDTPKPPEKLGFLALMKVGVVKEIKPDEYRVALTPAGARELVAQGHEVLVEAGAGDGSSFPDATYQAVGATLGGLPVIAVRASGADERERHRGMSHHSEAVLSLVRGDAVVGEDGDGWREATAGLPLSHMGRGPDEDPAFFASAYAAGVAARKLARDA